MIKTGSPVISIYTEMTPNPETMKFVANKLLYPGKSIDFPDAESAKPSPLATELFGFPFIKAVFIASNFVTLTKTADAEWMDVAFLIDYTGSMGSAIDSIKSEVNTIVNTIMAESGGDYRLALGIFDEYPKKGGPSYIASPAYTALPAAQKKIITTGTSTDQHLTMMEKFAPANSTSFSTQLSFLNNNPNMPMGWGINGPEPGDLLLNEILNNNFAGTWRTGNITKLAIIITDAPASGDDDNANATDDSFLQALATTANSMGVQCVLLTTFSGNTLYPANYQLQLIANNTGGSAVVAPTFSNISKDIISQIRNVCSESKTAQRN